MHEVELINFRYGDVLGQNICVTRDNKQESSNKLRSSVQYPKLLKLAQKKIIGKFK